MYAALGVGDIDSILQPPQQPQPPMPIDAWNENSGFMMDPPATALGQHNRQACIDTHRSLFLTEIIKPNPQLIIGHMMQHLQFSATSNHGADDCLVRYHLTRVR